jgi:hypothetical protein
MGEAKRRGTKEQRQQMALQKALDLQIKQRMLADNFRAALSPMQLRVIALKKRNAQRERDMWMRFAKNMYSLGYYFSYYI